VQFKIFRFHHFLMETLSIFLLCFIIGNGKMMKCDKSVQYDKNDKGLYVV